MGDWLVELVPVCKSCAQGRLWTPPCGRSVTSDRTKPPDCRGGNERHQQSIAATLAQEKQATSLSLVLPAAHRVTDSLLGWGPMAVPLLGWSFDLVCTPHCADHSGCCTVTLNTPFALVPALWSAFNFQAHWG